MLLTSAPFWSTLLLKRQAVQPPERLSRGHRHVSLRKLSEEFPVLGFVLELFALEKKCMFPSGLEPGSPVSGVWVLLVEYRELDSSGDAAILWGAMVDSTLDTCSASALGAFGRFGIFSTV